MVINLAKFWKATDMTKNTFAAELLDAAMFAAERHSTQRRKDAAASPYINHPLALARLLASVGQVEDVDVLRAALLHDTVEDTDTSEAELRVRFGDAVADIVMEVTDDKTLPKQRRKELQVEHAPHKSRGAALVKLADKTCNLRDIASSPPANWSMSRRQDYFDWAKQVVDGLPPVNAALHAAFCAAFQERPQTRQEASPTESDGHWLSMPGAWKGSSGFVRVMNSGAIEIELYDFSERAHESLGADVSTIYTVRKDDLPALASSLAIGFGGEPPDVANLPEHLTRLLDVQLLIRWLTEDSGVAFSKYVDFSV